ncbi:protein-export chaperone SecB [Enterococcus faecalis]|uniref:protein-export chaperone SecB n=1 Tax=Enterococcus faecalis TaxID=1351 RepID=UPI000CF2598B|nr:protein-export chaperone SecB [Enterococcus faecalis]EGO2718617.1 hypothetical protein [Enterococcus faecalis]EGO6562217.1 hypothetical protein [Enterococcus faecalis]EGS7979648.1 hypothetical protein [Enterococcus faecalis]EIP8085644.1 protein-export chaperone SecB [Enterococcus faecalis]NSU79605.1 protein-export chaperone SecB [Enterococcus faecalis]
MDTAPIYFQGYKINSIKYETSDTDVELTEDYKPEIEFGIDEKFEKGTVKITSVMNTANRQITITVSGVFKINKNYTDDKEEILNFLGLNGSAILLPYVRAIVSMLTTLDSNQAIVLPTINVMDLLNQE